jgi:hypothetical protein
MEHVARLDRCGYIEVFRSESMFLINGAVFRKIQINTYLIQHNWTMPPNVHLFVLLADLN